MRKRLFLLAVTLVALLLLLTSCSALENLGLDLDFLKPEPKTADELFARMDEEMEELVSFKITNDLRMELTYSGFTVESTAKGTIIEIDDKDSEYYYYEKMTASVGIGSDKETSVSLEAYHGGHYFLLQSKDGTDTQKLASAMTREEALALREKKISGSLADLDLLKCTEKSFTKRDDGSYTLSLSGYSATDIANIRDEIGLDAEFIGDTFRDIALTLEINPDYLVTRLDFTFVFEGEDAPEISLSMTVSDLNTAERITEELTPDGYTVVDDLAALYDLEDMWKARKEADAGSLLVELRQKAYTAGDLVVNESMTCDAVFGKETDGYRQTLTYTDLSGDSYTMHYEGGTLTLTENGSSTTSPMSEKEAKEALAELFPGMYDYTPENVTNISAEGQVYTLSVHSLMEEELRELYESLGATGCQVEESIVLTVENGALTKVEFRSTLQAKIRVFPLSHTIVYTITFR